MKAIVDRCESKSYYTSSELKDGVYDVLDCYKKPTDYYLVVSGVVKLWIVKSTGVILHAPSPRSDWFYNKLPELTVTFKD